MNLQLQNTVQQIIKSLNRIKEEAVNAYIEVATLDEQIIRIEKLMLKYQKADCTFEDLFELIREEFVGSFGMLLNDSALREELMSHYEITKESKKYLENELLNKYIINAEYESLPLIRYTERHGGPLWYDLEIITIKFEANNLVLFKSNSSLSKTMSAIPHILNQKEAYYEFNGISPQFISGRIQFKDGNGFNFETIPNNMQYIFLEEPQIWKESIVVKRVPSLNNFYSTLRASQ